MQINNTMISINRVMLADSYKYSHFDQYPKGVVKMFDYLESRGGIYEEIVFFGLQYLLKAYFSTPITQEEVEEAYMYAQEQMIPFNKKGWDRIVKVHKGYLPLRIKAVPEGMKVPVKNILMYIEPLIYSSEDFWVVGWFETFVMKVWYPTTVASKSAYMKKLLLEYSNKSGSGNVNLQYHNFGDRGATTPEAANIGGAAHLVLFMGTDNFHSLKTIGDFYDTKKGVSISIRASEHSTISAWGKDKEFDFYDNYLETSKGRYIVACVMDTYNIFNAVNYITSGDFKSKVESEEYPIWVIRPDSGDPIPVLDGIFDIIEKNGVAFERNDKGFKMLNKYRIIWGDGINYDTVQEILDFVLDRGYSSDNMAFGSGGDLMQKLNRDTSKFAIKCSSITFEDGHKQDVYKEPITDQGKTSKKGEISLYKDLEGNFKTMRIGEYNEGEEILELVYEMGIVIRNQTFLDIRTMVNQ